MINGLPGNMARMLCEQAQARAGMEIIPYSLTGPEITDETFFLEGKAIRLVRPEQREDMIESIKKEAGHFIAIDFTHPTAVNSNCDFYCSHGIPFVMGTTGGDREELTKRVRASAISAVIAPNMAKQIVAFQAMMEYAAANFPNLFSGYSLEITESHQKGKADTSGTAKEMVKYFNRLGIDFTTDRIKKIRDPELQRKIGVPEKYLDGHGWHTYKLVSEDQTVMFSFTHNVCGRNIYAQGTFDAAAFLWEKFFVNNETGKVYSMIDVLKQGADK